MTCGTTLFGVVADGAVDGMAEAAEDPGSDDGNLMSPVLYSEATLVRQTTAEYLEERLGWHSVYAYSTETFGPDGTLGRTGEDEVVLTRYLRHALESLNPGLPGEAVDNAIRAIVQVSAAQSLQTNQEKYDLLRHGVKVAYRDPRGGMETRTVRIFDFDAPESNHFLAVRELWIKGSLYRRRADLVGFVNGIPILFMEPKNIHRNVRRAYENWIRQAHLLCNTRMFGKTRRPVGV